MRYLSFVGLFVSLVLMGCPSVSEVDILIPREESKLVLNAVLNNEQPVIVFLSFSRSVLDRWGRETNYVSGATVKIIEDDVPRATLVPRRIVFWEYENLDSFLVDQVLYASNFIPQAGKKYRIEASHPDYDSVWAETVLPNIPTIEYGKINLNQIVDQFGFYQSSYSFSVKSESQTFIRLWGNVVLKDSISSTERKDFPLVFATNLNEPKFKEIRSIYWINEKDEDGQVFFSSSPLINPLPEIEEFHFNYTFSDSIYYAYRIAFSKHNESAFGIPAFLSPSEFTEIPSNVHGGYGMLGSFIRLRDTL